MTPTRTVFFPHPSPIRSLYYPPHSSENTEATRCGTHSDYGSITLLFQDDVGGLEVESVERDQFVEAQPIENTVLVNIGDLLQFWTSDDLRATVSGRHSQIFKPQIFQKHRVRLNDSIKATKARQSIAFFVHPDDDFIVSPVNGDTAKYPPISAGKYLQNKLDATY